MAWKARNPIILNGISDLAVADDLTDRALVLTLPPIPENQRRSESDLWTEFESVKGEIFGGLLDAMAFALGALG